MNPALRSALLFLGVLALVVAGSLFYSRSLRDDDRRDVPAATPETTRQPVDNVALPESVRAGIDAYRSGDLRQARKLLSEIPIGDPAYLVAQHNLGAVHAAMGNFEASLEALQKVVDLQPDQAEPLVALAWAQYRMNRHAEAEATVLRAIELDPNHVRARYSVALFRLVQGQLDQAVRSYHRAIGMDRSSEGFQRAHQELHQLHVLGGQVADVHYVLAFFAKTLGNRQKEIEELEHYLELSPVGDSVEVARARLAEARAAVN